MSSILQQERWAEQHGISADYSGHAHLADLWGEVLREALAAGHPLPAAIVVDPAPFRRYGRRAYACPAESDYANGVVYLNPGSNLFRSRRHVRRFSQRYFQQGELCTPDPRHVLRHEIGHLAHAAGAGGGYLDQHQFRGSFSGAAVEAISGKVSRRALCSPVEFVAEVFAGVWGGRAFDDEVMRWYCAYRGPAM